MRRLIQGNDDCAENLAVRHQKYLINNWEY